MTLRFLTAGDSHGPGLSGILDGMPSGVSVSEADFTNTLNRRWIGYGRGKRKKLEKDKLTILSGILNGITTGAPIAIYIENTEFDQNNSRSYAFSNNPAAITALKPGHADLPGVITHNLKDIRPIRERASARETAIKTALSVPASNMLRELNVKVIAFVSSIGGIDIDIAPDISEEQLKKLIKNNSSDFITPDPNVVSKWKPIIDEAKDNRHTLGGTVEIRIFNCPVGLGNTGQSNSRLDSKISASIMSLPAVKAVEIGEGIRASKSHTFEQDQIKYNAQKGFYRETNFSGGIDGGLSNGEPIVIKAFMKPIPGNSDKNTTDLLTKKAIQSPNYRSDTCALSALSVVTEANCNILIASEILKLVGGRDLNTIKTRFNQLLSFQSKF